MLTVDESPLPQNGFRSALAFSSHPPPPISTTVSWIPKKGALIDRPFRIDGTPCERCPALARVPRDSPKSTCGVPARAHRDLCQVIRTQENALKDLLLESQIENVFVLGLAEDYCVKYTALQERWGTPRRVVNFEKIGGKIGRRS